MNTYEAKQEAKRDRLELAADRADARSDAAYKRSDLSEGTSGIPLGQPILVGHHSEGRHRAALKRANNAMQTCVDEGKRADGLRSRAAAVGSGGISADDPDAVVKLQEKIDRAEKDQTFWKAVNKVLRMKNKSTAEMAQELRKTPGGENTVETHIEAFLKPDFANRVGIPGYMLTNNNANIRRMKERVEQLKKTSEATSKRHVFEGVCEVFSNTDENRLQFLFDGKPSADVRKIMKSHGFRWAPSQGAWQRQLTNNARYSGKLVLRALGVVAS